MGKSKLWIFGNDKHRPHKDFFQRPPIDKKKSRDRGKMSYERDKREKKIKIIKKVFCTIILTFPRLLFPWSSRALKFHLCNF